MRLAAPTRILLLLCAGLLAGVGLWAFWDHTVDDAYITLRYAHHLAAGAGLTWNPGQAPVEGYTNFLWTVLLAGADRLGLPLVLSAKLLGVACLLLTGYVLWRHVRVQSGDETAAYLALFVLLAFPPTYVHTVSGLETMAYALLLLLATITAERQARSGAAAGLWQVPLLVLLAGLTRPEGVLVGAVPLLALLVWQPPALRRRTLRFTGLVLVLPGALYFAWRLHYFGWLLPNTFYVKVGYLWPGLGWAFETFLFFVPLMLVPLLLPGADRNSPEAQLPRRLRYYLVVALVAVLPYALSIPMMNYEQRFAFPVFPLLAVAIGLSIAGLRRALPELPPGRWLLFGLLLLLVVCRTGTWGLEPDLLYGYHLENAHVPLGRALAAAAVAPADRSLAVGDAGAIPYYSDWQSLDLIGLNDTAIAHGADPAARIRSARPALLILYSDDGRTPRDQANGFVVQPLLTAYEPLGAVLWTPGYYLSLYLRADLPEAEKAELRARLLPVAEQAEQRNRTNNWVAWLRQRMAAAG